MIQVVRLQTEKGRGNKSPKKKKNIYIKPDIKTQQQSH